MARSITDIQAQILANIAADSTLGTALTSTSKRAIYRLLAYVVAVGMAIHEQLIDVFQAEIEGVAASAPPSTPAWIQKQVFAFQYDSVNPQIVQLVNLVPTYPVVDTTKQIITQCSVRTDISGSVRVKVAKQSPPVALASGELSALQTYLTTIGIAGINYIAVSQNSDKLYVQADIYFDGQYITVIQANVIAAINSFLSSLPFDGSMSISNLEVAIKAVAGVKDVVLNNVIARNDSTALSSGTYLVQSAKTVSRLWQTQAGYIVSETTTGSTLADTLNFIAS
jgi:hypothetical protein